MGPGREGARRWRTIRRVTPPKTMLFEVSSRLRPRHRGAFCCGCAPITSARPTVFSRRNCSRHVGMKKNIEFPKTIFFSLMFLGHVENGNQKVPLFSRKNESKSEPRILISAGHFGTFSFVRRRPGKIDRGARGLGEKVLSRASG